MKTQKIFFSIVIACFVLLGCKTEQKKDIKKAEATLAISGMTCEIGCAKTIQSKLSKKEGVLNASVIFNDSIAKISYDANATSKKELIAFIDGIAGGELYKAKESKDAHICTDACKEKCETKKEGKACCKDKTS